MGRRLVFAIGGCLLLASSPSPVQAEDAAPPADLMPKLAAASIRFESLITKSSFTVTGHMESVDGDGAVSDTKDAVVRLRTDEPNPPNLEIVRYTEDGKDKTDEARKKTADKAKEKKKRSPDDQVHMPFLASQQPLYTFRLGEADARDPNRVRVFFTPKHTAKNLFNGSAWVDARTGDVLTMGVAPSETSTFVDYLRVTLEFGETTAKGPSISKVSFEGGGGFLFFKKRFRGSAVFSAYDVR
jgi:hypothetical protein